jgi:hypothetical protein
MRWSMSWSSAPWRTTRTTSGSGCTSPRWLRAPVQRPDGTLEQRTRGTPQGGVVSPLLANLFLHYAFDHWMQRSFPSVPFERYADDAIVLLNSNIRGNLDRPPSRPSRRPRRLRPGASARGPSDASGGECEPGVPPAFPQGPLSCARAVQISAVLDER